MMTRHLPALGALLAVTLLLAGCPRSGGGGSPSMPAPSPAPMPAPPPPPMPPAGGGSPGSPGGDGTVQPSSAPRGESGGESDGRDGDGDADRAGDAGVESAGGTDGAAGSERRDGSASADGDAAGGTDAARGAGAAGSAGEDGEAGDGGDAMTAEERRAAAAGRLDESLGGFDAELRKEQQRTAQERDARAASSGRGERGGREDGSGRGNEGRDRSGDLRSDRDRSQTPAGGSGTVAATGSSSRGLPGNSTGRTSADGRVIPDGSDDDIIARRLRKAAEDETDPELKDKLWKEYLDYKSNARSGS